jgi:hypothetical protein
MRGKCGGTTWNKKRSMKDSAARLARRRRAKRLPLRVDRKARKAIREFAASCAGSGGFYVG